MTARQSIAAFLRAPTECVRIGYELETQTTDGLTYRKATQREAWVSASKVRRLANELMDKTPIEKLPPRTFSRKDFVALAEMVTKSTKRKKITLKELAELLPSVAKSMRNTHYWKYDRQAEKALLLKTKVKLGVPAVPGHATCSDGTVRGFEFKTDRPIEYTELRTSLSTLFRLRHRVDTGCSFHVHLSVNGITHKHTERFQQLLILSTLSLIDQVPDSVLARWADAAKRTRFFAFTGERGKYTFVSKHSTFNTWEFRCFGNVRTKASAELCVNLAIQALTLAYQTSGFKTMAEFAFGEHCRALLNREVERRSQQGARPAAA